MIVLNIVGVVSVSKPFPKKPILISKGYDTETQADLDFISQFENPQHGIMALNRGLTFEEAFELGFR